MIWPASPSNPCARLVSAAASAPPLSGLRPPYSETTWTWTDSIGLTTMPFRKVGRTAWRRTLDGGIRPAFGATGASTSFQATTSALGTAVNDGWTQATIELQAHQSHPSTVAPLLWPCVSAFASQVLRRKRIDHRGFGARLRLCRSWHACCYPSCTRASASRNDGDFDRPAGPVVHRY